MPSGVDNQNDVFDHWVRHIRDNRKDTRAKGKLYAQTYNMY